MKVRKCEGAALTRVSDNRKPRGRRPQLQRRASNLFRVFPCIPWTTFGVGSCV